ncbi:hypothetical protein FRC07_006261, partial [Ceratobasidium sp. 392]
VAPKEDSNYVAPKWTNATHNLKKRRVFWKFGVELAASPIEHVRRLGVAVRLYALLPAPGSHDNLANCFQPASDFPCKKKMAQLERQSKQLFSGTGMVILSMALARHDIIWYMSKHTQNWYLTQSATHRILQRCTAGKLNAPEEGLSKAIHILQEQRLKEGMLLAEKHFPKYGVAGSAFHALQNTCSTSRGGNQTFDILERLLGQTSSSSLSVLKSSFLAARQGMIEYAQSQDTAQLGDYLERFPILLELLGSFFFNKFEFMRYVHGGRAGATMATLEKSPLAVISSALGMGLFVQVLEKDVMCPLMEQHERARNLLLAAAAVEEYAPNVVDGESESLWWQHCMPWKVTLLPHEGLPSQMVAQVMPGSILLVETEAHAENPNPAADVTITPMQLDEFGLNELDLDLNSHWKQTTPDPDAGFSSTFPAVPQSGTLGSGTPTQPTQTPSTIQVEVTPSSVVVPAGRFVRWEKLFSDLPFYVSCPYKPASTMLHNIQGTTLAIRNVTSPDEWCLGCLEFAHQRIPTLLKGLFAARKELRDNLQWQSEFAMQQSNPGDYVVNVLAPMAVQLKVAKVFMNEYYVDLEEAQTETLFMALGDRHWEKDFVHIDNEGEVWVDYACTLPAAAWKHLRTTRHRVGTIVPQQHMDHALASMFNDGFGLGLNERTIQQGTGIAHVLQDIQKRSRRGEYISYTNSNNWNSTHTGYWGPLRLDQSFYDKDDFLKTFGRALHLHEPGYTCWTAGSPFSQGVFVDWSCLQDASTTQLTQWGEVESALHDYQALTATLWDEALAAALHDVQIVLGASTSSDAHTTDPPSSRSPATEQPEVLEWPTIPSSPLEVPHVPVPLSPQPAQTVPMFVPQSPSDEGDIYNDTPLSPQQLALLRSKQDMGPPPVEVDSDSSSEVFVLRTGVGTLAMANAHDSDDPDNFMTTTLPRDATAAQRLKAKEIDVTPGAYVTQPAQPSGLLPGGLNDPDDPDNFVGLPAGSFAAHEAQTTQVLPGTPSTNVVGRKRAATQTSPNVRLHKRPA